MGGVSATLLGYWCRGGCSTATVAAALTFFPPESTYDVVENPSTGETEWRIDPIFEPIPFDDVKVTLLYTRRRQTIPAFMFFHREAKFTLIHCHGNATDCGAMHDRYLEMVQELKINVLAFEYTGYGSSTGQPSEADTYADIEAAYELACKHVKDPAKEIILYGQSVGSGPACKMGMAAPICGMVLHSPIMSGMRVLTPSRALACLDIYPNIDRIKKSKGPVFVIHGVADEEVHWSHGLGLYEALSPENKSDPWWVADRGHNDICEDPSSRAEYYERMRGFLRHLAHKNESSMEPL